MIEKINTMRAKWKCCPYEYYINDRFGGGTHIDPVILFKSNDVSLFFTQ